MVFKVSVVIPVYNAASFIKYAVESVLNFEEVIEVLLVDDISSDDSLIKIRELEKLHDKVKSIPNSQKRYASGCRNLAIREAKGNVISFLDADDWYYPNRFNKDKSLFLSVPEAKVSYSFSTINYPDGRTLPYGEQKDFEMQLPDGSSNLDAYRYVLENDLILGHVNANTVHIDVFKNGDYWDERLKVHADTEFWWRINRKYRYYPAELEKPVSAARRHDHNTIYLKSIKTKTIMLLVWIDNIGLDNIYDFERKVVIYQLARAISNPIRAHFLRRTVLHLIQIIANSFRSTFISLFYKWGMKKFNLYKV
jgi:glycosyltransferase involved in cell wall biosynthesis